MSEVLPLLRGLVDDAGLFPPERLPMADAVSRHRRDQLAGHAMLTHRFLCPASRLEELQAKLTDGDLFRLGLIADSGIDGIRVASAEAGADPRLLLDLVEVPLAEGEQAKVATEALDSLGGLLPSGVTAYLEPRRGQGWLDAVAAIGERAGGAVPGPYGAKVRCGGVRPELFPSVADLASFVRACVDGKVAFKATAGLHHAVRYRDPVTGFDHHGFLNLLVATGLAVRGSEDGDVRAVLGSSDGAELAARARELDADIAPATRELLVSYGSCSTSEPIDDAAELGLVAVEGK